MTLHGNVLTSEEAGEIAGIIDRDAISTGDRNHEWFELNECNAERCPVCKADYASITDRSRLLELHRRLAARVAELESELADACKRCGEYATKAGHAEGELLAIGWQGGPEKVVAGFRKENERLRKESERRLAECRDLKQESVEQADELVRLRAELAGTPPTLEWLKQQFGEPRRYGPELIWDAANLAWINGTAFVARESCAELTTRAAVLAAVAAAKGEA